MTKNIIAFQNGFIITPNIGIDNRNMAMVVQSELMQFGYMLDYQALDQLGHSDAADIKDFHNEIIHYLKTMTGGLRDYKPVYPGFPQQVMAMSELELWVNQLVGYWSGGTFTTNEWPEVKGTAFEYVEYKMIEQGDEIRFASLFTQLLKAGASLTPNDMKTIVWFIDNYAFLTFPEVIPFKENLCTVIGAIFKQGRGLDTLHLPKLTTTDVLRVAVYLSGGNIALPALPPQKVKKMVNWRRREWVENPERELFRFKKFSRKERRFLLDLLEHSNLNVGEMKLKLGRWIRLGEILHPGEYASQFPKTNKAFITLRNQKVKSWYGQVNEAFDHSFEAGLTKLSERPGEFLRRLDWLVRSNTFNTQPILDTLSKIGLNSSNKVLFEVYSHFEDRRKEKSDRRIMIKGARKHTQLPTLPAIDGNSVEAIQETIFYILKQKFTTLPEMGDCWIDPELKKIPLPTNMRSLNDSLVPMVRGSRIPFGQGKKVVRPFIHWYDECGDLDLDLHGFLVGENVSCSLGYNGIHNDRFGCYSGDVRNRQGACAEYADIVVNEALADGFKYFIMIVHNFNGGPLSNIKECVAGVEEREFPEANKTWLPSTIKNSMLLKSAGNMIFVAAFDLETREYIPLDLDFSDDYVRVYSHRGPQFYQAILPLLEPPKVSVYDLLLWHVEARGRLVSKDIATTHFLYEDFATSYKKTIEFMGV